MFAMKKECSGTFDLFTSSWRHVNPVLSWSLDCLVNSYFKAASISSEDMAYLPIEYFFSHNQFFVSTSIFNAEIFILLASKSMMTRWYFMHIYTRSETDRNMIPAYCIQNEWNIFQSKIQLCMPCCCDVLLMNCVTLKLCFTSLPSCYVGIFV